MKRFFCLIMFVLVFGSAAMAKASASGPVLSIDTNHVYEGMEKSYAHGYLPTVSDGKAAVVLPLFSESVAGSLTAAVSLGDPANSPFVYKNFENQFDKKSYTFDGETVESYLIWFALPLTEKRVNGNYPVTLRVSGVTDDGETFLQEFVLYAHVGDGIDPSTSEPEPVQAPSSQPKLMVESYKLDQAYLEAGESAALTVTIRNTSSSQSVKNIKFAFSDGSGEILPVGTGTKYRGKIAKGSTYSWSFDIMAATTAQSKPHLATISMEYEDSHGNPISTSDQVVLQVRQPVRLEYEEPAMPVRVTQGDTPTLTMTLMNLGKSTIYNALLKVDIPGLSSGGIILVGTIQPGNSQTGRTNFRVGSDVLGTVEGLLHLSYEDEYGEYYEKEIPLSTTIEKNLDITPAVVESVSSPVSAFPRVAYIAGGIFFIILAYILLSRYHKQKKAREEDEMRL
ncbi:MAG: hypothetical protein SCK29_14220 [Bacillota bacterium]|nr:hypothetical protein [Bacillota bacterium]MDW7685258.1 hypothetical protein [Bacillota bacterium]